MKNPFLTGLEEKSLSPEPSLEPEDPFCGAGVVVVVVVGLVVGVVVSVAVSGSFVGSVSEDGVSVVDVSESLEVSVSFDGSDSLVGVMDSACEVVVVEVVDVVDSFGVSDSFVGSGSLVGSVFVDDGFGSSEGFVSVVDDSELFDGSGSLVGVEDSACDVVVVEVVDVVDSFGVSGSLVGSDLEVDGFVGDGSGSLVGSVFVDDGFGSSEGFFSVVEDSELFVGSDSCGVSDSGEVGSELGGSGVGSSDGSGLGSGSGVGSGFSTIVTAGKGVAGAFLAPRPV